MARPMASQKPEARSGYRTERRSSHTPLPSDTKHHNGSYLTTQGRDLWKNAPPEAIEIRDRILAELPVNWRVRLPSNPTPLQECAAWMADVQIVRDAAAQAGLPW